MLRACMKVKWTQDWSFSQSSQNEQQHFKVRGRKLDPLQCCDVNSFSNDGNLKSTFAFKYILKAVFVH